MCEKGILVNEEGVCDSDNECQLDDCDFCTRNDDGSERCALCESDEVLRFTENGQTECISEESDETEDC